MTPRFAVHGPASFTVLGAAGYIGGRMVAFLRRAGHAVYAPRRGAPGILDQPLGHVIDAIGLTADFRSQPIETMEAHVGALIELLRCGQFESLTYLSSTRVYAGVAQGSEDAALVANPNAPDDLYNLSKMAGEALCLALRDPRIRVARLSNVYGGAMDGPGRPSLNFLASLLRAAAAGRVMFGTSAASVKDYVAVEDVERALYRIALGGAERVYNVASGRNTSNGDLASALRRLTGCQVEFAPAAATVGFPAIDTRRLATLFPLDDPWAPADLLDRLPELVSARRPAPAAISGGAV